MSRIAFLLTVVVILLSRNLHAAQSQVLSSAPATIMAGTGTPTANSIPCNVGVASATSTSLYNQRDITTGNSVWKCSLLPDGVTYAWQAPFSAPVLAIATTGTFAAQAFLLSGCTAILTVNITGAAQGNAFTVGPIFATAPTAGTNIALLNVVAWFSGTAGVVNVQGCASGVLGVIPAFTAKVQMY
jgi:hypothetical protein